MKRLFVVAALIAVVTGSQAQEAGRSNAIKINPLSLIFATGNVSYERAIGTKTSVQLGGFYSAFGTSSLKYSGYGFTPEVRFYFAGQKQALNGVYAAPFVRYQSFNLEEKASTNKTTFTTMGGGATLGWQKMWGSGFVLDLFAGPAYNKAKFKNENDEETFNVSAGLSGFGVRAGITLGFGF
ncbi:MAG TPA: DUF3575 domain-containing protein [Flavitalea sp.]|nr:DUF3575 domain-containing protein [Flavitalea sp.]